MSKSETFKQFNKFYLLFLDFIKKHMKDDTKFNTFYFKNKIIAQTNIKLFIKTWYSRITSKYYTQIMNKDLDFFLNKTYSEDVEKDNTSGESPTTMLIYISNFKQVFPTLHPDIKKEFTDFMMYLTNLSFLYFKE
jgi:hypothetical protein